jgi:oxalate decarboxylase/phosphoglucose isomerase-like protein (cupin superfamily)
MVPVRVLHHEAEAVRNAAIEEEDWIEVTLLLSTEQALADGRSVQTGTITPYAMAGKKSDDIAHTVLTHTQHARTEESGGQLQRDVHVREPREGIHLREKEKGAHTHVHIR